MNNYNNKKIVKLSTQTEHNTHNFSFEQLPRSKSSLAAPPTQTYVFTPSQQRNLSMFLLTITYPPNEQLVKSVYWLQQEYANQLSVQQFYDFMRTCYPHFQEITKYYVIAALVDFGLIKLDPQCNSRKPHSSKMKEQLMSNLVEELGKQYHRESLWMQKISHIPFYEIFGSIDEAKIGYISRDIIGSYVKKNLPVEGQSISKKKDESNKPAIRQYGKLLVCKRLSGNIWQQKDPTTKILQENWVEYLMRLQLKQFLNHCSSDSYRVIHEIVEKHLQKIAEKKVVKEYESIKQDQQNNQLWRYAKQNYQIKDIANKLVADQPLITFTSESANKQLHYSQKQPILHPKNYTFNSTETLKKTIPNGYYRTPLKELELEQSRNNIANETVKADLKENRNAGSLMKNSKRAYQTKRRQGEMQEDDELSRCLMKEGAVKYELRKAIKQEIASELDGIRKMKLKNKMKLVEVLSI